MLTKITAGLGFLGLVFLAACGKTVGIGSDAQDVDDAGGCSTGAFCDDGSTSRADASVDGTSGAVLGEVGCPFGQPTPDAATESYTRSCTTKAECAVGYHPKDCCGTRLALGIAASEVARFAQGLCPGSGPGCGCDAQLPQVVDGDRARFDDGRDIAVRCVAGGCEAYVASFACGDQTCDSRTDYCEAFVPGVQLPDGGGAPIQYTCQPVPSACTATPTCACIGSTVPDATCSENKGRVTVTRGGV